MDVVRDDTESVVVGVDGSDYAARALAWAEEYAEATGAVLRVVVAWRWPDRPAGPGSFGAWSPERDAHDVLANATAGLTIPAERLVGEVVQGPPAAVLVERAEGCRLLVLGSRGARSGRRRALGSVALHCLRQAACSVTVVR